MSRALLFDANNQVAHLLDGDVIIGRNPACNIVLQDASVSGTHAKISCAGSAWYITDCNSRNGVTFNDARIPPGTAFALSDGKLKLGTTVLYFSTNPEVISKVLAQLGAAQQSADPAFEPEKPEKKHAARKRDGKHARIGLIALCLVVVASAVTAGYCFFSRSKGNRCMENGDYPGAIAAYNKDFLFGSRSKVPEAALLAGEEAFEDKDYLMAADYFESAGEAGEKRWEDALYQQALLELEDDNVEEAVSLLEQTSYDVTEVTDSYYHDKGNRAMSAGSYDAAKKYYERCEKDPEAKENAAIITKLASRDFYDAAVYADEAIREKRTDVPRSTWQECFETIMGEPTFADLGETIREDLCRKIISGDTDTEFSSLLEPFRSYFPKADMVGSYSRSYTDSFTYFVPSLDELYAKCGSAAAGKFLILVQKTSYPDKEKTQVVSLSTMRLLPIDLIPKSLDEVEYVAIVCYDHDKVGKYQHGTAALREKAWVEVFHMPDNKRVYVSKTLSGDKAPSTITYYFFPPVYHSEGAPAMGDELYNAMAAVLEK